MSRPIRSRICSRQFLIANRHGTRRKLGAVSLLDRARRPVMSSSARKKLCARADHGEKVVLARIETSPEDLRGMIAAEGILTSRGGVSSHAALVARQMGKVCVCGATGIQIDYQKRTLSANGTTLNRGRLHFHRWNGRRSFCRRSRHRTVGDYSGARRSLARPKKSVTYQRVREVDEVGGRIPHPRRAHKCRHA